MHDRGDPAAEEKASKYGENPPADSDEDWGSQWPSSPKKNKSAAPQKELLPTAKKRARPPVDAADEVEAGEQVAAVHEVADDDYISADEDEFQQMEDPYSATSEFAAVIAKSTAVGVVHAMGALQNANESGATASGGEEMIKLSRTDLAEVSAAIEAARASAAHAAKLSVAAAHAFRKEHDKLVAMQKKIEQITANK